MRCRALLLFLSALIITLPTFASAAPPSEDKSAATDAAKDKDKSKDKPKDAAGAGTTSTLSAMSGGSGSGDGASVLGTPVSTQLDPFSGSMAATIPIAIPPGRKGMQPDVALTYFNGRGNGWVGVGWQLEPGAIERQTKFGVSYAKEEYVLRMNGSSQELVQLTPGGTDFRAKIEGGFLRIKKLSADGTSGWEITAPNGRKMLFGRTTASRRADPQYPTARIFTWLLDRIEDPHTNYVSYTYTTDTANNEVYLDQISYTGFGTTDGLATVKFYREAARTDAQESYVSNYRIRTTDRLKSIGVYYNNTLQRAYQLTYDPAYSLSTFRSLLTKVEQFDKAASINTSTGAVTGSTLPSTNFSWHPGNVGLFNSTADFTGLTYLGATTTLQKFADVNGDGRMDWVHISGAGGGIVHLSLGQAGFDSTASWSGLTYLGTDPTRQILIDVNRDGKADWIHISGAGGGIVHLNNGQGGFNSTAAWSGLQYLGANPNHQKFADVNRDGCVDWIHISGAGGGIVHLGDCLGGFNSTPAWSGLTYLGSDPSRQNFVDLNGDGCADWLHINGEAVSGGRVHLANCLGGFADTQAWLGLSYLGSDPSRQIIFDVNGDRCPDWVHINGEAVGGGRVHLGNCQGGFLDTQSWGGLSYLGADPTRQRFADVNGDGRPDWIHISGGAGGGIVHLNDGLGGFSASPAGGGTQLVYLGPNPPNQLHMDVNGDGLADWVHISGSGGGIVHFATTATSGAVADQLQTVSNGIGATTTINYTPSTQFTNAQLPFPVQVVSSITTNDGNGNVSATSYSYNGGFHHIGERDFRGFHTVWATGPTGPNGEQTIAETRFHQGNDVAVDVNNPNVADGYMKGKPYRSLVRDGSSNMLSETTTAYAADADSAAPWFTPPQQVLAWTCAGTSSSCAGAKQTRTEFTTDHTYGNVTQEDHYGDTSTGSDDRTIVRTFSPNATDWIVSLPTSETIYQGIPGGTQKAQTTFYYDGTTSCSTASTNQTPTKGLLTRVVRWLNGGTSPETRMAYDSYGNPTCVRDPRGNVTNIAYDSGTHTFPLTVTNAANHVTTTAYYGVNGVAMDSGLFGQTKSATDPNGRTASNAYDTFGRPSTSTAPNGLVTTTTYNSLGTVGSQHVLTSRTVGGVNFQSWTYFDGQGRTIKAKGTGPQTPSAQNIVSLTEYNVRGQVKRSSLPHFDGGTPLWRSLTYDPLGRVRTVTTPDGKVTTTCYAPWVTVVINPKSQKKRQVADAFGRTVEVNEYTGSHDPGQCSTSQGSPYATTTYAYDTVGNLTSVTDALGNQTTMTYDTLSRKTAMHDPDMGNWSYVYDAAGNLTQQTDAKNQHLYFQYDTLNRRQQKDFGTQKALGSGDVVYTYDGATAQNLVGRLASVADSTGTMTLQYDVMGQINQGTRTLFGTAYPFSYTHDAVGRLLTVTYPDSSVITYTYNGPFPDQVKEGSTVYAQYHNYNALGQPVSIGYSNGVNTYFTYETNTFRQKSLQTTKDSTTLQNLEYAYDDVGNVQSIADYLTTANSQTFTYDELNRLLTGNSSAYGTIAYTYNQIGNMLSNSQVGTYSYPASGSASVHPHAVTTAGSNSYTYDANGNMLTGAGRTFNSYDFENRPTSITSAGQTTTFVYNGDGGRVKKQTGSNVTWYISKLYECDTTSCFKFIWSGDKRIVSKKVTGGTVLFYHGDHLGSSSVITDSSGSQVQALTYYPFGQTRTNTNNGAVDVVHKYTGKELDGATGLYWHEWRSYDPVLGRFTSPDTIVSKPGDPQDLNRFAYARNNPLVYTDPTGHFFKNIFKTVTKLAAGALFFISPEMAFKMTVLNNWQNPGRLLNPMTYYGQMREARHQLYDGTADILEQDPTGIGQISARGIRDLKKFENSRTGRYIEAGAIVAAIAVGTAYCGGCGVVAVGALKGALVGSVMGLAQAAATGGDPLAAVVIGGAVGAAAGALGGQLGQSIIDQKIVPAGFAKFAGGLAGSGVGGAYRAGLAGGNIGAGFGYGALGAVIGSGVFENGVLGGSEGKSGFFHGVMEKVLGEGLAGAAVEGAGEGVSHLIEHSGGGHGDHGAHGGDHSGGHMDHHSPNNELKVSDH